MSFDPVKNFAVVTVSTGYDAAATSIALTAGHGARLPQPSTDGAFNLVWWNSTDFPNPSDDPNVEIVRVTARSTDTLTVTRAQESTSASTKNTSLRTYKMILAFTKSQYDHIGDDKLAFVESGGNYVPTAVAFNDPFFELNDSDQITPKEVPPVAGNRGYGPAFFESEPFVANLLCTVSGSGTQTIPHGLGRVPRKVEIKAMLASTSGYPQSVGTIIPNPDTARNVNSSSWCGSVASTQVVGVSPYCVYLPSAVSTLSTATGYVDDTNLVLTWEGGSTTTIVMSITAD